MPTDGEAEVKPCGCGALCDFRDRPGEPCWGEVCAVDEVAMGDDDYGWTHACTGHEDDGAYKRNPAAPRREGEPSARWYAGERVRDFDIGLECSAFAWRAFDRIATMSLDLLLAEGRNAVRMATLYWPADSLGSPCAGEGG